MNHASAENDGTPPADVRELRVTSSGGITLAALLFRPRKTDPVGGVVVCHGAGSAKENHVDFALAAVERGLAAIVFDFRGHGASGGAGDGRSQDDVVACAARLRAETDAPWLAARGTSMGGYYALWTAAGQPGLFRAVVGVCTADEQAMLAGLARFKTMAVRGDPDAEAYGRFDIAAMRRFFSTGDVRSRVAGLTNVLLVHARDDDSVPFASCERLYAALSQPKRLFALEHGGHTGLQHDPQIIAATLEWIVNPGGEEPAAATDPSART